MEMKWYVLQAFSGYENKVKQTLEDTIKREGLEDSFGEILVPTEEVLEIKEGQKSVRTQRGTKIQCERGVPHHEPLRLPCGVRQSACSERGRGGPRRRDSGGAAAARGARVA